MLSYIKEAMTYRVMIFVAAASYYAISLLGMTGSYKMFATSLLLSIWFFMLGYMDAKSEGEDQ